jgi:hemerythrin-like domain-containing protein
MDLFQPVPDFDRPIEALYICHTNILKRMDQIDALAAELLEDGAPVFNAQVAIWQELVSFFRHSIANHTRDEDDGLFPLLDGRGGAVVERMEFDHRWIEQSEETMINRIEALISGEHPMSNTAVRELAMMAREVTRHYRDHIRHENEEVFPLAEQVLNDGEKRELTDLMRLHRGITYTLPPSVPSVAQKTA